MIRKAIIMAAGAAALAMASPSAASHDSFTQVEASIEQAREAMMGDPEDALAASARAMELAADLPSSKRGAEAQATARWLHGESLIYLNRIAEARPIVNAAIEKVEAAAPGSKLHGDLLRSRGAIGATEGNVLSALRDYQAAHRAFREADVPRSQAIALQDIGMIYFEADDFARALDYFDQASQVYSEDPILMLTGYNNRAEVLRKQGNHAEATAEYRLALVEARALESPMLVTRILTNLAASQADEGDLEGAATSISEARRLAANGDAAGWQPFVFGIAAKVAYEKGEIDNATNLITRTFEGQDLATTELLFREYHQTAATIYDQSGQSQRALAHFKAFQRLDSEARQSTASTASQLLGARFDFANLKRGQLERDIELERQKGTIRNNLLAAASIILLLLAIGFLLLSRSRNRVRKANLALTAVNAELEHALRAKTEFLATTSHEIRTPLNGILGMTQVLLTDRNVANDVRERIEVVHGAGETMRALVDDILDMAKIEHGNLTIVEEEVDLRSILRDTERLWGDQAESKGLTLDVTIEDMPERIITDGGKLRQIVFNLMSNAIKFTPEGSVKLAAKESADGQFKITVSDTGIGMPAPALEEIFEPFKQVEGSMSRQFSGTGLGLAICRQLAEALGGSVSVTSTEGQGSVFTVSLPLVESEASKASTATGGADSDADSEADNETGQSSGLASARLLVADPEAKSLGMMGVFFSPHAASLSVAKTYDEVTGQIEQATHLLMDSAIADCDPTKLRDLLAAAHEHGCKVTLLHDPEGGTPIADMMMIGADQLIIKPIAVPDILPALSSLYSENPEAFVAPALMQNQAA